MASSIHKRSGLTFTVVLFVVSSMASICSAESNSVNLVDFGIYTLGDGEPQLLIETDQIPPTVGTVFGIRVAGIAYSSAEIDVRWTFPEMTNPDDGRVWTEMTSSTTISGDDTSQVFARINRLWEAVAGDWIVQISINDQVVLEKVFRVSAHSNS